MSTEHWLWLAITGAATAAIKPLETLCRGIADSMRYWSDAYRHARVTKTNTDSALKLGWTGDASPEQILSLLSLAQSRSTVSEPAPGQPRDELAEH